jgi:hypothetical protein
MLGHSRLQPASWAAVLGQSSSLQPHRIELVKDIYIFFIKVWWQYATLFVSFSFFITYIQSSNHIHTIHSPRPLSKFTLQYKYCRYLRQPVVYFVLI